jgi:hypothetical protein
VERVGWPPSWPRSIGKDERPRKFTTKAATGNGFQYRKYEKLKD